MQHLIELIQSEPSLAALNKLSEEQRHHALTLYLKFNSFDVFYLIVELAKQGHLDLLIPMHATTPEQFRQLITVFKNRNCLALKLAHILITQYDFKLSFFEKFSEHGIELQQKIEGIILKLHHWGLLTPQFVHHLCQADEIVETINSIFYGIEMLTLNQSQIRAHQLQVFFNHPISKLAQICQFVLILSARNISLLNYIDHISPQTEQQGIYLNQIFQHWPVEQISQQEFLTHIFKQQNFELIHQQHEIYRHLLTHFQPEQALKLMSIPIQEFQILEPLLIFIDALKKITYNKMELILSSHYPSLVLSTYFLYESLELEPNLHYIGFMQLNQLLTHLQLLQKIQALNQYGEISKLVSEHDFHLDLLLEIATNDLLNRDFLIASYKIDSPSLRPVVKYLLSHQHLSIDNMELCFGTEYPMQTAQFICLPEIRESLTEQEIILCCEHNPPMEAARHFLNIQRSNHFSTEMFHQIIQFTSTKLKLSLLNMVERRLLKNSEILSQIRLSPQLGAALFALNVINPSINSQVFHRIARLHDKNQLHDVINLFIDTKTDRNHLEQVLLYPEIANLVWLLKFYCASPSEEINLLQFINDFPINLFAKESICDYIFAFNNMRFTQDMLLHHLNIHRYVLVHEQENPFLRPEHLARLLPSASYKKQQYMLIPFLIDLIAETVNGFADRDNLQQRPLFELIFNQNIVIDVQRQLCMWSIIVYMLNSMHESFPLISHQQHIHILSASLYMVLVNAQASKIQESAYEQFLGLLLRGDLSFLIDDIQFRLRQIAISKEVDAIPDLLIILPEDENEQDNQNNAGFRL